MSYRRCLYSVLFGLSVLFWGNGMYLYGKAWLAQSLIESAWEESVRSGNTVKPWGWADTWVVARLRSNHLRQDLYVLAGADGSSLAFGPGQVNGSALPGKGASVIGGHRDTHFNFLQDVAAGDELAVQLVSGDWQYFRVVETRIDDIRKNSISTIPGENSLTLVTCYPFNEVVPGGPLRYVVTAEPVVLQL